MNHPVRVVMSVALLVGALLFLQLRSHGEAVPLRKSLDSFPTAVGEWSGRESTIFDADVLNVLKVKDYLVRRYVDGGGRSLWLYIGYWDSTRKGVQPHSPKNCLPGAGWEPVEASLMTIPLAAPYGPITVNRFLIQKDREQQLMFYWYQSQGNVIASEFTGKIFMLKSAMLRNRTDTSIVRVSSQIYGSVPATSERLVRYVQSMYPQLNEFLPD
jgi:EpsI family protein